MTPFVWLAMACGGLILAISMGIRQAFGLFLPPLTADLSIGRETFAFAMAIQQIFWGGLHPFFGVIADRYGAGRVIAFGGVAYAAGLYLMSIATGPLMIDAGGGVLVGTALAATTFGPVLGAVGRLVPPERRSFAFGLVSAGGSLGIFIVAPISHGLISGFGWSAAFIALTAVALVMVPLAVPLAGKPPASSGSEARLSLADALGEAGRHPGYWYLNLGFFVCGFHVSFVAFHLPAYLSDMGLPASSGALALVLIGFFNVVGTYLCGLAGARYAKKYSLSTLYFLRAIVFAVFLAAPKTELTVMVFASAIGLLWLGTVPLTSGLVAHIFGVRYLGTLFGIVFVSHQIGGFVGVWWAGWMFDRTGSYDSAWIFSIVLALAATLLHLPIAERPVRLQPAT